jgi:hypothetical protein
MSTIIAEVLMVLITILLSAIVFVWAVPTFQSQTSQDNAGAAYSEKFQTVRGQFATYVQSIPETVTTASCPANGGGGCPFPSSTTCNGATITVPTANNIFVPANGNCTIKTSVGNVFVDTGGNLTMIGGTINGQLIASYSLLISLQSSSVTGFSGIYNVATTNLQSSAFNTAGDLSICTDACGAAMYGGGRGEFTMYNSTVTGQVENEVGHQTFFVGNTITGRLEIESADFGQVINNNVGSLDFDQNGAIVISSNTVHGTVKYGVYEGWCGTGNNAISGSISNPQNCVGNVEVDVENTGASTVKLVSAYMTNYPLAGGLSWRLASGHQVQCGGTMSLTCTQLPILIPAGDMAQITMGWTPPPVKFPLPWNYIYFIFVSSHGNYVDGYLFFTTGLGLPTQSRIQNRICPPCY